MIRIFLLIIILTGCSYNCNPSIDLQPNQEFRSIEGAIIGINCKEQT
jgi:hypothetical protein